MKTRSKVDDTSNIDLPYNVDFTDYFYYNHEGVIAERHDDIGGMKYFTRLGGELLTCNSGGSNYFYIQNIRGDVLMLVDEDSGYVKSIRDYDSSGGMLSRTPRDDRDPFGFTGGIDAGNGLWKLGARFYDSGKGNFIQQDRYMGDPSDPLSLNRYVYCQLDPVNNIDPTGFNTFQLTMNIKDIIGGAVITAAMLTGVGELVLGVSLIAIGTIMLIDAIQENESIDERVEIREGPIGKAGRKEQGREVNEKKKGDDWVSKSGKNQPNRPMKKHTPGREHRP